MSQSIKPNFQIETKVSSYDAVNAFLISSIVVIGTLVSILFMIWLTMIWNQEPELKLTLIVDPSEIGNEKPEGFADDIHEPGVEEFPEVDTPQLADALEALTDAVSSVRANRETRDGDSDVMGKGGGFGSREGGPGNGNSGIVPEHKRWKIEYNTPDINKYARQLSFFKIDIGVISNLSNDVVRLRDPGGSGQVINTTRKDENKSLFFIHEKRQLRRWDERMTRDRSIDLEGRFTVQFYADTTRAILRQVEATYLQKDGKELKDVRKTGFKIVEAGSGFNFVVSSVEYQ